MAERNYLSIGQVVNLLRGAYPDLSNSKIRFLEDEGLITPHRTPKGYRQYSKEDVDRLEVILHLQKTRYHIEPRNLRQYVSSANRESSMFEQVLVSMLGMDTSDDERDAKLERAFKKLHDLTEGVHTALLKNRVFESLNAVVEDADIDALDEEITRSESTKAKNEETAAPASHEDSLVKPLKVVAPSQSGTVTAGK